MPSGAITKDNIKKLLLSSASVYLIIEVLAKAIPFVSISLFSRVLNETEFANYSLYISAVPVLASVLDLSQVSSVKIIFLEYKNQISSFIKSIYLFVTVATFVAILLFALSGFSFMNTRLMYICLISAGLFSMIDIFLSYLNISYQKVQFSILYLSKNILPYLVAIILFINVDIRTADTFALAQVSVFSVSVLTLLILMRSKKFEVRRGYSYLKRSIALALPLVPTTLSGYLLTFSDRYMIDYYLDKGNVAEYTIAFTVASILTFIVLALNNVWQPFLLNQLKNPDLKQIRKKCRLYILAIGAIGIILVLLQEIILIVLGSHEYLGAENIVPVLVLANFFYFLYTIYSSVLWFYKKKWLVSLPVIISALLNIGLNFYLLPIYGYEVAAYTTLACYIVQFLIVYLICKIKLNIDFIF